MSVTMPKLYKEWHADRGYELDSLFRSIANTYSPASVLYPDCYVHITPSMYIPQAVYVDVDKNAAKFFADPDVYAYIESRKVYSEKPHVTFYHQSYTEPIPEPEQSFDLLISQYAGFVSEATKKYLKYGGLLVANNSHGDAGLVHLDPEFQLLGVVHDGNISTASLSQYFIPKKDSAITVSYLKERGRSVGYTKTASNYIFQKVKCSVSNGTER